MEDLTPLRRIRSFVRREGRMTPAQRRALDELWPHFGLTCQGTLLDFPALFGNTHPVFLEIGFGMGNSLAQMAKSQPQHNFLGIEVHRPGVGTLLNRLQEEQLPNVRVMDSDAVDIVHTCIGPRTLAGVLIFFPDPWMKKRHHKRRLVQAPLIAALCDRLQPGGIIHLATDWEDYAQHMLAVMEQVPGVRNRAGANLYSVRPEYRPITKYETRGQRLGHGVWDLIYERT